MKDLLEFNVLCSISLVFVEYVEPNVNIYYSHAFSLFLFCCQNFQLFEVNTTVIIENVSIISETISIHNEVEYSLYYVRIQITHKQYIYVSVSLLV